MNLQEFVWEWRSNYN